MKLKVICAWCMTTMQIKELDCRSSESTVSHGICEPCKYKTLEEILNKKPQNQERR